VVARGEVAVELWSSSDGVDLFSGGAMISSSTTRAESSPLQSSAGMAASFQPPTRRPFTASVVGVAAKWFILVDLEVSSGGCSSPEEGTRATFPCSSVARLEDVGDLWQRHPRT
jgi:hypothetical protein